MCQGGRRLMLRPWNCRCQQSHKGTAVSVAAARQRRSDSVAAVWHGLADKAVPVGTAGSRLGRAAYYLGQHCTRTV